MHTKPHRRQPLWFVCIVGVTNPFPNPFVYIWQQTRNHFSLPPSLPPSLQPHMFLRRGRRLRTRTTISGNWQPGRHHSQLHHHDVMAEHVSIHLLFCSVCQCILVTALVARDEKAFFDYYYTYIPDFNEYLILTSTPVFYSVHSSAFWLLFKELIYTTGSFT